MNNPETSIETLIEKTEQYGKTSQELFMLQAINKSADVLSSLIARLAILVFIALSLLIINIGVALWLGKLLGHTFFGFFIIGAIYALIAILFHLFRNQWLKYPLSNSIIKQMMKHRNHAK